MCSFINEMYDLTAEKISTLSIGGFLDHGIYFNKSRDLC